ncbi:ribosome maturation factor RimM [Rivularia sp. UHCC 0363]|uniref:ribosome maturation factor RimM n=1 Tax=Rivularia sp. UHCC 0363 TaxID=3110244 RepID=UPI002B1FE027|nr:ribosome maturation factor RimM [Rivularia sp. UHCC 0363]MEA5592788.1 ribosome maturation factor RimM [Rivularia sp. UHCC 0363]
MIDNWLEIGKIVAPQGMNGELRVYPETDFPERFEVPGKRWLLRPNATEPEEVELVKGRFLEGKNLYVIQLAGVKHRDQAEQLRDCKLCVPESDRPALGEDEYHLMDLVGLPVFMQETGEFIGTVIDLIAAGNDLLEVRLEEQKDGEIVREGDKGKIHSRSVSVGHNPKSKTKASAVKIQNQKTVLIPFVKEIVPVVDLQASRIEITPPTGLLEIS